MAVDSSRPTRERNEAIPSARTPPKANRLTTTARQLEAIEGGRPLAPKPCRPKEIDLDARARSNAGARAAERTNRGFGACVAGCERIYTIPAPRRTTRRSIPNDTLCVCARCISLRSSYFHLSDILGKIGAGYFAIFATLVIVAMSPISGIIPYRFVRQ